MTDERRARVESLFHAACELSPEKRQKLLDREAESENGLRSEVEELLNHHDAASPRFLECGTVRGSPVKDADNDQAAACPDRDLDIPREFGRYLVIRRIGVGGMGAVYEAQQDNPRRRVALKIVRSGFSRPDAVRRFRREAQLLGTLQHPAITHIYEAGTVETQAGEQPFFAMEFVDGEPIDRWARDGLRSVEARIEVVARVCEAVQHAHERGIVHRDLKPGNILIDMSGQPKILDFGIARAVEVDTQSVTLQTEIGQLVGTVPYMSPEQVRGDSSAIGTSSDVYALGVLLFELLAGRLPLQVRGCSIPEAARIICEDEPSLLSSVASRFRGDLDTILAKAMEKSPDRRYRAAAELAEDLRRYLRNEPILARPASTFYQIRKFAQRNRKLVAAMAIAFASLLGATIATSLSAMRQAELRRLADEESRVAKRAEYHAKLLGAQSAMRLCDAIGARRVLGSIDPTNQSKWEWRHLQSRLDMSLGILEDLGGAVQCVDFSPDGRALVTGSTDGLIRIWDVSARNVARRLHGHDAPILDAIFTRDGGRIVSSGADDSLRIWDSRAGECIRTIRCTPAAVAGNSSNSRTRTFSDKPEIISFDVSPDGRLIVAALRSQRLVTWDMATGALRNSAELQFIPPVFSVVRFLSSPDSPDVLLGWYHGLLLIRPGLNETYSVANTRSRMGPADFELSCVSLNPNTKRIASGSRDKSVVVWDSSTLEPLRQLRGHTAGVDAVALDPRGKLLASGSADQTVRIWDADSGQPLLALPGHTDSVNSLAFSPNGDLLGSGSRDGTVRLWSIGALLSYGKDSNGPLQFLSGPVMAAHTSYVYDVVFNPTDPAGRQVASVSWDGRTLIWDAATGEVYRTFDFGKENLRCAAFHPNGHFLAIASNYPSVHLRDLSGNGRNRELRTGPGNASSIAFSPDGKLLAVTQFAYPVNSENGAAYVWNLETGSELFHRKGALHFLVAACPTGLRVATFEKGLSRMADAATGRTLFTFNGVDTLPNSLDFSPDGRRFIIGMADGTAMVWSAADGQRLATLRGHTEKVYDAVFSPDMKRIATCANDNYIRIWDADTYEQLLELVGHQSYVYSLAFSPDGSMLLSASGDSTVRVWDTIPLRQRGDTGALGHK